MSKYIILLVVCMSIFIWWCAKSTVSKITFDDYLMNIASKTVTYKIFTGANKTHTIYQTFTSQNTSGFTNSIIISKNLNDTKIPLAKIAEINIKKIQTTFKWFKSTSSSEITFTCDSTAKKISADLETFTVNSINEDQTLYLNQLFFIDQWYLYIVSTSTEDKSNNKELKKMLKKIKC